MSTKRDNIPEEKRMVVYFREYCNYTGIHGFRYIGENRTLTERIWWTIWLPLSMFFCGMMVYQVVHKYINYPVLITFSMKEARLQQIPFPAVTICPMAKFSLSYYNITTAIEESFETNYSDEKVEKLGYALAVCSRPPWKFANYTRQGFYKFLNESRTYTPKFCSYISEEPPCEKIFSPILTEEGVCHSFNILDKTDIFQDNVEFYLPDFHSTSLVKHWDVENGYTTPNINAYPRRALRVGQKNAFYVELKTQKSDIEYQCAKDYPGYMVMLHFPSDIPDVSENNFKVPLGHSVTGVIIPQMIKTSEDVKQFNPKTRDCYFQSERPLKFFKIYSQANCLLECKANYTLRFYGCVGFWMPNDAFFVANNDYSVIEDETNYTNFSQCDCLPTCTDISYRLELSQSSFSSELVPWKQPEEVAEYVYLSMTLVIRFDELRCRMHDSILTLYFRTNHIETRERNELYSISDVISNFGGLLGLFTGFSLLSAIEIVYFLSLRIWANIKLFGHWSGPLPTKTQ
nr:unnamed protein product [Callosobruchus chinensis]